MTHIFVTGFSMMPRGAVIPAIHCHLEVSKLSWKTITTSKYGLTAQNGFQVSFGTMAEKLGWELGLNINKGLCGCVCV